MAEKEDVMITDTIMELNNYPKIDYDLFKKVFKSTLRDSKDILILANELDKQNNNGDIVDIDALINIDLDNKYFLEKKKIFLFDTKGNPYKLTENVVSAVCTQNALIANIDCKNHTLLRTICILAQTIIKESYGLNYIIVDVNEKGYKEFEKDDRITII